MIKLRNKPVPGEGSDEFSPALAAAFPFFLRWDAAGVITAAGRGWRSRAPELVGQPWDRFFCPRHVEPGQLPAFVDAGEPEVLTLESLAAGPSLHGPRLRQAGGAILYLGTPLFLPTAVEPWGGRRRAPLLTDPVDRRHGAPGTRLAEAVWQCLAAANGASELLASLPASLGPNAGAWLVQSFQFGADGRADAPPAEWCAPGLATANVAALRAQLDARRKFRLTTGIYSLDGAARLVVLEFTLNVNQTGLILLAMPAGNDLPAEVEATVLSLAKLLTQFLRRSQVERAWADERSLTQNVLELMGQGLTVSDGSGHWIYVNAAYARLAQRRVDELIGTRPDSLAAPEDLPVLAEARRLRGLGQANTYEMSIVRPDGSRLLVLVSGVPRWVDGKPAGAIAVTTDLTTFKETERRMQAALDREQELNREKNAFMRMATHEYRTPIATITYAAELLGTRLAELRPLGDPKQSGRIQRHAQLIMESALQMNRLLDNLMLLWRLQTQEVQMLPKRVGVGGLMGDLLRVAGQAGQMGRLRLVVEPSTPETFPLDAQMLRLAVLNLVDNALKYSPSDQPVTVRLSQPADGMLHVAVEDRGPGISPADQERIFNAFYRGANVEDQPGTGIGLTIAQRCARLHGGDVNCRAGEAGGGTVFLLSVPEVVPKRCELGSNI
jgi:PAS domain S-box-containing protein